MLARYAVNLPNTWAREFHIFNELALQAADSVGSATFDAETSVGKAGTVLARAVNVDAQPTRLNRNASSNRRLKTANSVLLPLTVNVGINVMYGNTKNMIRPSP